MLISCCVMLSLLFVALGCWQLQRRVWKLDLIERTTQRVHAAPVAAPGPLQWSTLTRANAEYLRVRVTGRYLPKRNTLVKAVTDLGSGYWVMSPLRADDGFTVLINRGFVTDAQRDATPAANTRDEVTMVGLLRFSEPEGGFLRHNDAAASRWFSRDVAAVANADGLPVTETAPYFIDAAAKANSMSDEPVGGLTVVSFYNHHLSYALTWFVLAIMPALFILTTLRNERRARTGHQSSQV